MISQTEKKDLIAANQARVIDLLGKMKPQLALCLPKHMSADRVCRIALTEFRKTPLLMECEPMSFIAAVMVASQLGLEIGILGSAYIVPFRNTKKGIVECNLIPGYRGFIDLARRSGNIISISAEIVYEKDLFDFEKGLNEKLIHKPVLNNRGEMIAAYAVAKLKDGGAQFIVMSKQDIDKVKSKTKSQYGPWSTEYEAMAQKTVVRRLFKWLPSSVEMQKATVLDEHNEIGIQDIKGALIEDMPEGVLIEHMQYDNEEINKETGEIKSQADELAKKLMGPCNERN
jgi:recombination protein RecT